MTEQNRIIRVQYCKENLAYYRDGPGRFSEIITGDETWFYYRNIGRKASNASWVAEGETPKTVVRRSQFERKTMFIIFFRSNGMVHVDAVPRGETIDANYYIQNGLTPAFKELEKQRKQYGTKNIKLLHDNAKCHANEKVYNFLEKHGVKLIKHPPYSPDLAPCDFWLFDFIKRNLESYEDEESLLSAVTAILRNIAEKRV